MAGYNICTVEKEEGCREAEALVRLEFKELRWQ
jgi:hypothetical protein